MLTRLLLAGVMCCVLCGQACAEPTVYLRGKRLSYRHFIYGEVSSSSRKAGTINLGYAHGFQLGQYVGVLRKSGGNVIPIGALRLVKVRSADALGEYEGDFTLQRDDVVIASARELTLWQRRSRSDQLVTQTLLARTGRGYDTGEVSPALLNEVGRDDDLIAQIPTPLHVNAERYSMQRPVERAAISRGAFRPSRGLEDGTAHSLSEEDRRLSPDLPTLDLESALARFVLTNASGNVVLDGESLQLMAKYQPGLIEPELLQADLERANMRVRSIIQPH